MTETIIIALLLAYIVIRELVFLYSTHKLLNKLMSHNFHDYTQSLTLAKEAPQAPQIKIDDDEQEDLGTLHGIGVL